MGFYLNEISLSLGMWQQKYVRSAKAWPDDGG
jgi:hypothetical protein